MLDPSRLLAGANEWWAEFSNLGHTLGFNQEKFSVAESQEGFRALRIGTTAEHVFTACLTCEENSGEMVEWTSYRSP